MGKRQRGRGGSKGFNAKRPDRHNYLSVLKVCKVYKKV
jgi:hypothetical protein